MTQGRHNCEYCLGRGRVWKRGRWMPCTCTRVTMQVQSMLRAANQGTQPYKSVTQRIQERDSNG